MFYSFLILIFMFISVLVIIIILLYVLYYIISYFSFKLYFSFIIMNVFNSSSFNFQ